MEARIARKYGKNYGRAADMKRKMSRNFIITTSLTTALSPPAAATRVVMNLLKN